MTGKMVEGLWDCPYCGADKIGGLRKYCPSCGHPQSEDTTFYLGKEKKYLTDEIVQSIGKEPDWKCEYCTSLNNAKFQFCKNCGAERTEENKDYHQLRQEEANTVPKMPELVEANTIPNVEQPKTNEKNWKKLLLPIIGVLAVVIGLVVLFAPRSHEAVVYEKAWERSIEIEEYRTVEESSWDNIPNGGRLLHTKEEIRSYNHVLSHYETRTREVAEQVFDGYDVEYYYEDNGNGTFTEHSREVPRYRTEYHTETYEEPIYVDVPIYDTKYYYEIERWVYDHTEESSGINEDAYWPKYTLEEDERTGTEKGEYAITFYVEKKDKTYEYDCESFDEFESYALEEKVSITVTAGAVTEIQK